MEASRSPGVMARGRGSREGSWETGGCTYHYHATYPMMPLMLPPPPNKHMPVKTLPSRNFTCGRSHNRTGHEVSSFTDHWTP